MANYLRYIGVPSSVPAAPTSVSPPTITGPARQGATLTANVGQVAGSPTPTITWQWFRGASPISGATGLTYVQTADDVGSTIAIDRIANNGVGSPLTTRSASTATVTAAATPLGSDPHPPVDASSFGMKTMAAVGSMAAGSQTLNLVSNPGFVQGDQVIVENVTNRGTKGVGGVWPALNYADINELNADTTTALGTYAWIRSTGKVYVRQSGAWVIWSASDFSNYYWDKAEPFSLIATVTNVNGLALTLSLPAQIAVSGANVTFDNSPKIKPLGVYNGASALSNATLYFGAGTWCFSEPIKFDTRTGVTIAGAGKNSTTLKSPKNTPSISIQFLNSSFCHVRDLEMLGNARDNGFGTGITTAWPQNAQARTYTRCILFTNCSGGTSEAAPTGTVKNVKMTDPWTNAVGTQSSNHVWAYDCDVYAPGFKAYIQWMFQFADSTGGGARRCKVYGDKMVQGFEAFRSNDVEMSECGGTNCAVALNSPGNWLFRDFDITVQNNAGNEGWHPSNPVVSINNNINPPASKIAEGGEWRNCNIIVEGSLGLGETGVTAAWINGIVVGPANPNIKITGTHDTGGTRGLFQSGEALADTSGSGGRYGILSDSAVGTIVEGFRLVGGMAQSWSFHVAIGAGQGTVKNSIMNSTARVQAGTKTNNLSNADYLANGAAYTNWLAAVVP